MTLSLQNMHSTLQDYVRRDDVALMYYPEDRFYCIYSWFNEDAVPPFGFVPFNSRKGQAYTINFCPITGGILPGELFVAWMKAVQEVWPDFGDELFPLSAESIEKILPEFKAEEWWIKRNVGMTSDVLLPGWVKPKLLEGIVVEPYDPMPAWDDRPSGMVGWSGPGLQPGMRRFRGRLPHLCERLEHLFSDERAMIAYIPWTREYGIRILNVGEPIENQPHRIVPIYYCPCCGDKLPDGLRPQWMAELQRHGLTAPPADVDALPPAGTPPDLASEDWWRAQGL